MRRDNANSSEVANDIGPSHSQFESSNLACARSIAREAALSIDLDSAVMALQLGLRVPEQSFTGLGGAQSLALLWGKEILRGLSDAIALVQSHHNPGLHEQVRPNDPWKAAFFDELELVRCEAIGSREFSGVASNMAFLRRKALPESALQRSSGLEQLRVVLGSMARTALGVSQIQTGAQQKLVMDWADALLGGSDALWNELATLIDQQDLYAITALKLLEKINWQAINNKERPEANDDTLESAKPDAVDNDPPSDDEEPESTQADNTPDEEDASDDLNNLVNEQREEEPVDNELVAELTIDSEEIDSILPNRDAPVSQDTTTGDHGSGTAAGGYRVFSTEFDEVVHAQALSTAAELDILRDALDTLLRQHENIVGKLAGRLQRLLMSKQQRHWQFDLDEGQLDTSRLTRLVTQPLSSLTFKQESDIDFKDTVVTLLVDNSKSMLGKPINIAAACSDILAQTLERCGIAVEILGFTTTELHGGAMVDRWQAQGARAEPGRLNALRHIVYKSAETPYRSARKGLGLMLRKDLLKQNIDGEALLWAQSRLAKRPEQRKVLMVVSDGAPIDTSTMSANAENLLVDHLHEVVRTVQSRGDIELMAIGIGHDVSQYYQRAITIYDPKYLSKAMLEQFVKLFV